MSFSLDLILFCLCRLPDVFCYGTIVDDGGYELIVIKEELCIEFLQCRLEAQVVGLVGIHLEDADDAADTCRATAALADGRIAQVLDVLEKLICIR